MEKLLYMFQDNKEYINSIENADVKTEIDRKTLWRMWSIIMSVPFENRNNDWNIVSQEVRRLLNITS